MRSRINIFFITQHVKNKYAVFQSNGNLQNIFKDKLQFKIILHAFINT